MSQQCNGRYNKLHYKADTSHVLSALHFAIFGMCNSSFNAELME